MNKSLALMVCVGASSPCAAVEAISFNLNLSDVGKAVAILKPLTNIPKDRFEKSDVYRKKVCLETLKAIGISEGQKIAVRPFREPGEKDFHYNADKQRFQGWFSEADYWVPDMANSDDRWVGPFTKNYEYSAVILSQRYLEPQKGYVGTNAFGVSKEIHIGFRDRVVIYIPRKGLDSKSTITLSAKPDIARKLDGDLRLAITTSIGVPCIASGTNHQSPTLSYPYEKTTYEVGLVGSKDAEWLIYRESTKEILKRGKFN